MKPVLLNPGPVNLSDRVRQALLRADLCHREKEFIDLQNSIRNNLLGVYELNEDNWAAVLLTGSGTAAVEAMITSIIPENGHLLTIENGVYGERISKIATTYKIPNTNLHHEWGQPIDIDALDTLIQQEKISHVALVHHETTSGRLNNLEAIASICKKRNIPVVLDGVSSFGAEEIKFDEWNITACAATANKCLHGVPGTSFVICNRKLFKENTLSARNLYLDLNVYLQQQDNNGTPFTQSVQCFYALDEALKELYDEGGWQKRNDAYWQKMEIVRNGFKELDIKPFLKREECSCVLNAFYLSKNMTYDSLHDGLKENGFIIYSGQGGLAKSIFRISCMGSIGVDDIKRLVSTVKELL